MAEKWPGYQHRRRVFLFFSFLFFFFLRCSSWTFDCCWCCILMAYSCNKHKGQYKSRYIFKVISLIKIRILKSFITSLICSKQKNVKNAPYELFILSIFFFYLWASIRGNSVFLELFFTGPLGSYILFFFLKKSDLAFCRVGKKKRWEHYDKICQVIIVHYITWSHHQRGKYHLGTTLRCFFFFINKFKALC